jgi:hypothetical protein
MTRVRGYDTGNSILEQGRTITVISETVYGSGVTKKLISSVADGALISLFVTSITGSLSVRVLTETSDGKNYELFTFPTVTAPSTALTLKTASPTMTNLRFEVTYNGDVTYELHARGVASGEVSAKFVSPASASANKVTVGTLPTVIIPATTSNRSAVLLRNLSATGTIYLGFSVAQATESTGFPLFPGEHFMISIAGGQPLYGLGTVADMDIRYVEATNT